MNDLYSIPTETVGDCLICESSTSISDVRTARLLGLVTPFQVRRCKSCGLRWLDPRPTAAGYERVYSKDSYFEGPSSLESFSALESSRFEYFANRLKRIERLCRTASNLRILDIGAATGHFVRTALHRGHTAEGYEFSAGAREEAKARYGLELSGGELEDFLDTNPFDVIHMNHVFEHLPNPRRTLQLVKRMLKTNGLLIIEVPQQFYNDMDRLKVLLRMRRPPKFNVYSIHHTYFFTPSTLKCLTEKEGFVLLSLRTSNWARTPLRPFTVKNLLLGTFLELADRFHRGGNIIEVFARHPVQ